MTHFKEVCEFGKVHAQCRCPNPNKDVREIRCDCYWEHDPDAEREALARVEQRLMSQVCRNCGGPIMGDDAGGWLHVNESGMATSRQCSLFARPINDPSRGFA